MKEQKVGRWVGGWVDRRMDGRTEVTAMPALDAPFTCLPFIYLLVKEMWGEVPLPSSVLWCRAVSSPLPEPPCSLRTTVSAGPAAHGHITNPRRQHVAQPPHGPAPCPHVLCKTVPGGSQGKASPTCGTPSACSHGHQCGHRTGFRASLGQRTSWRGERAGGSLAGRGHPGWQRGCP